jgi:hypothetical protein
MKNTTTKHHQVEHEKGIHKDGIYQLTYTTCPLKSYVVQPDEGQINYDKFKMKKAE